MVQFMENKKKAIKPVYIVTNELLETSGCGWALVTRKKLTLRYMELHTQVPGLGWDQHRGQMETTPCVCQYACFYSRNEKKEKAPAEGGGYPQGRPPPSSNNKTKKKEKSRFIPGSRQYPHDGGYLMFALSNS